MLLWKQIIKYLFQMMAVRSQTAICCEDVFETKYITSFGYMHGMRQSGCQFLVNTTRMPKNMNQVQSLRHLVSPCLGAEGHTGVQNYTT